MTPANVLADTYCLNEDEVKETLAPITSTVIVGPPKDCKPSGSSNNQKRSNQTTQFQKMPSSTQQGAHQSMPQWTQPIQAYGVPTAPQPVASTFPSPYQTMSQQMQSYSMSIRPEWTAMASSYPAYGGPQAGQQSQQAAPLPSPAYPGLPMPPFPR